MASERIGGLSLDDLRLVAAVARHRTLPAAADALHLAHSTLFRRLNRLEKSLGAELFLRHREGYAPTPAGEEMVAVAARVATELDGFERKLKGRLLAPAGELRVTTNDALLVHLLTPLFARFAAACPEVQLDLVVSNRSFNLARRDADVAIRATEAPPETLIGRRVAELAWALYGRADDYPHPVGDPALEVAPWVAPGEDLAGLAATRHLLGRVPSARIVYRVNGVLGLAEAVEAGLGIGYLPCFIADTRPALRRLAEPVPELAAGLWLLTHADLRRQARVRVFLDFMAAELTARRELLGGGLPLAQPAGV